MNRTLIYLLTLGVFLTATSELVVAGILNVIAENMGISVALTGQLITVYSLSFAIGTPIMIAFTSRLRRKRLLLISLAAFIIGCLVSFVSTSFPVLLVSRAILGLSAGVYLVVTFSSVTKLVPPEKIGSAIGTVILGFSSAMVLGVPIGITISNWVSWQTIFILLAILSFLILYGMYFLLPEIDGDAPVSFRQQLVVLTHPVLLAGLFITFFKETGSSVMFTYLTPFLETVFHMSVPDIAMIMLIFGIVGAVGSRIGGSAVDRWGAIRVIACGLAAQVFSLAVIPLVNATIGVGMIVIGIWIFATFLIAPAVQTYFIQQAPQFSNLVLSLNTSIIHLGLASGAGIGGFTIASTSTFLYNPWAAGGAIALSFVTALLSFSLGKKMSAKVSTV